MSAPLITVLMTVYNGGTYLPAAIDSVLRQTYRDFEFLIIEDKGTDGSLGFLRSLRDPRVRVHANAGNMGQTRSLNIGLELARGQYVARMDADDLASPRWLENLRAALEKDPSCVLVSPLAAAIGPRGGFSRVLNTPRTQEDIILKSLFASPINHVGTLMRRKVILDDMGGYDASFKVAADYDLWSRLLRQGRRLEVYPKSLVSVRFHGNSATALEMDTRVVPEMTKVMRENIGHWKKIDLDENASVLLWRLMYAPEILSTEQYREGLSLLNRIYGPCHFLRKQKRIVFAKRVLGRLKRS